MIPILYESSETHFNGAFVKQGIGRLDETISCTVTETLTGVYELQLVYPLTGRYAKELMSGGIISALRPYANGGAYIRYMEPFEIYRFDIADDLLTISAHHVSYKLAFTAVGASQDTVVTDSYAAYLELGTRTTNMPSIAPGSIAQIPGTFKFESVKSYREYLYDDVYSFRKVYGVDVWFRDMQINIGTRGENRGAEIRYGKNLTKWAVRIDRSDAYNAIVPFWQTTSGGDIITIYSNPRMMQPIPPIEPVIARAVDFASYLKEQPSTEALSTVAWNYLVNMKPWEPHVHVEVDFLQDNSDSTEAPIDLGDTLTVYHEVPELRGKKLRVVEVKYNPILERFETLGLGDPRDGYAVTSARGLDATRKFMA